MQDKINKVLNLKVCVVDARVEKVFDGILSKEDNLYIVKNDNGSVLTQFCIDRIKSVKGNAFYVI